MIGLESARTELAVAVTAVAAVCFVSIEPAGFALPYVCVAEEF